MMLPLNSSVLRRFLIGFEIFNAIGALAGGGAFLLKPDGSLLQAPPSLLEHSPFSTFLIPGLILFVAVGLGQLGAAVWLWARRPYAAEVSVAAGAVLVGWIVGEIYFLRAFHWLQVIYLVTGLKVMGLALMLRARERRYGAFASA